MNAQSIIAWIFCRINLRRAGYRLLSASAVMCALLIAVATPALANPPLTVHITSCKAAGSTVTGFVGDYPAFGGATGSMRQFLGIPYAAPPTGPKRWLPPAKVTCWSGDRAANLFSSACPQGGGTNEDCLYLNVFTKPTGAVSKQPVMVYIHGGGLTSGSGSYQANPASLVAKNVIVVTINYRLGALGFLAHPALDSANLALQRTGNYGFLDQIAALKWVKSNIAKFGGDPNNVTIFGQSAGGLSVLVHLLSPLSDGLFHKAIIESGAFYAVATPLATAETQGTTFATNVGCNSGSNAAKASCLRALSVSTVLSHQGSLGTSVSLLRQDGMMITDTLRNLLVAGQIKNVPIINGSNHDETRFHIAGNQALGTGTTCNFVSNLVPHSLAGSFTGAVDYHNALDAYLISAGSGGITATVEALYPAGSIGTSANIAYASVQTDRTYNCRPLRVNKWIEQSGGTNYGYEFNDKNAPPWLYPRFTLHDGSTFDYGAYHGAELEYLFRMSNTNACGGPITALTATQKKLAAAMVTYWTTFAKTGDPNPTTGIIPPNWPQFTAAGNMLSFVGGVPKLLATNTFDNSHKCASFWDANSQ